MSYGPTDWLELSVEAPAEFVEPLAQVFLKYGNGGVAVEEIDGYYPDEGELPGRRRAVIRAYMPLDSAVGERRSRVDVAVRLVSGLAPVSPLAERILREECWRDAWKRHFKPLRIGRGVVIRPTWSVDEPEEGETTIWLDSGMAFGTGHHPTTRMCIEQIERDVVPAARVLDVGCGSGILSIAAVRLGASEAVGLDLDAKAVQVAHENGERNGVADRLRFETGSLRSSVGLPWFEGQASEVRPRSFDLAVANISRKVIVEIAPNLTAAVRPGGRLIVSGILVEHEDSVRQALSDAGAALTDRVSEEGWTMLAASV